MVDFAMGGSSRPLSARMSLTQTSAADQEAVTQVSNKFKEDANYALEEAIARHNNTATGGIPTWFWAVFLWYASDNFIGYMSNPICFYPLCLIATGLVVCH